MQIYVHRNNQQLGPFTEEQLKAQLASGAVSLQDHVWWQGQANWVPLGQTPLAATLAPGVPAIPGAVPSVPGAYVPYEKTSNLALWSMICGIAAFVCGIAFLPAIILGHMGLSETKKNPAIKGRGMAIAGLIMGYLYAVLFIVIVVVSVLIALGNQVKGTFKQVQATQVQEDSDSSTNSTDQSTNNAPSDSTTNSNPNVTP